jgi:hypothetical protein
LVNDGDLSVAGQTVVPQAGQTVVPPGEVLDRSLLDIIAADLALAKAALLRIRRIHRPWGVYGECGHGHTEAGGEVKGIDDIGLTCLHEYDICTECCTDGERFQTEACASGHDHGPGKPICATTAALDEPRNV